MNRKQVGILLIATNKYKQFVQPLIKSIKENFLSDHDIKIFLFTDIEVVKVTHRGLVNENQEIIKDFDGLIELNVKIHFLKIPSYKFPEATIYRYKIFDEHKEYLKAMDYLFYLDVDMAIVSDVGEEILGEGLTVTRHPGFYNGGWGSQNVDINSTAYIPKESWGNYYAGGFNGGKTKSFLELCRILNKNISIDELNNIIAEHNDESHLNHFVSFNKENITELDSGYCMVEDLSRRKAWGIDHLFVRIIALNKDHKSIRA